MSPNIKTSISVKSDTRKRIKYIAEIKSMDYDELINWALDELRFPTWTEVQTVFSQKSAVLVKGGV